MFLTDQYDDFKDGCDGFVMNNSHVYFWNNFRIWYLDTRSLEENLTMHRLALFVDPEETETFVHQVCTGSVDDKIVVKIR